jgi:hypothetical protein
LIISVFIKKRRERIIRIKRGRRKKKEEEEANE